MTEQERLINKAAAFLPMTDGEPDDGTLPCIMVGGVQVYAYFDEGTLHVSVDYDTAGPEVISEDDEVPTEVSIGGRLVIQV